MAIKIGICGDNILTGTNGSDVLLGLGGNDTLNGGGADILSGGIDPTAPPTPVNHAPVAADDSAGGMFENSPSTVTGNVITDAPGIDIDPDGDSLSVVGFAAGNQSGQFAGHVGEAVEGMFGIITIQANGPWSYARMPTPSPITRLTTCSATRSRIATVATPRHISTSWSLAMVAPSSVTLATCKSPHTTQGPRFSGPFCLSARGLLAARGF